LTMNRRLAAPDNYTRVNRHAAMSPLRDEAIPRRKPAGPGYGVVIETCDINFAGFISTEQSDEDLLKILALAFCHFEMSESN